MLEFIEIVRHGLPLTVPRTWLFIATLVASGIAGWNSLDLVQHLLKKITEE
ncbi:hypothetical protein [Paraburkholderia sp. CI3]|uniref:hypothetical protein n=1 Tax=Paraburkholderia sp. CI3 TaxID=2991060 RepID=UPI003D214E4E